MEVKIEQLMYKKQTRSWEQTVRAIQRHRKQEKRSRTKVGKYHCTDRFYLSRRLLCHSTHIKAATFISDPVKVKLRGKKGLSPTIWSTCWFIELHGRSSILLINFSINGPVFTCNKAKKEKTFILMNNPFPF